jgi:aconitate hydratase
MAKAPRTGIVEFHPARLLLQDFTGIPVMVDLASLRDEVAARGLDPARIDPCVPVDFVVDHALIAEYAGSPEARRRNELHEIERNAERFAFLKWCAKAFPKVRILPPGSGIMHQLNLEHLATVVSLAPLGDARLAYPDTLLGTDSHTTMINGLGVLGIGVGGLEAEAGMLGFGTLISDPRLVGLNLKGRAAAGVTATDIVLHITERLRAVGVTGAFVEVFGEAVTGLPVETRATISNMAPEYGAASVLFPIDERTLDYLRLTNRDPAHVARIEAYAKAQGLWGASTGPEPGVLYDSVIEFDIADVEPCMAGPSRPDQRVPLSGVRRSFLHAIGGKAPLRVPDLSDGDVVIAAITSCTSTANPSAMIAAGLFARNALARGLAVKPWVKTSFAPGSRVVADYLSAAGLQQHLDALGFHVIGFGCTTCNGNSGALPKFIGDAVLERGITAAAVLSGNRNFEGRIHPLIRTAYLAAPALVIAHAITGTVLCDLTREPLGHDGEGKPVMVAEIWPDESEIAALLRHVSAESYAKSYGGGLSGHEAWQTLEGPEGVRYPWNTASTFFAPSPIFSRPVGPASPDCIEGLRALAILGDAINTDHLSPNGQILPGSPAGQWLTERGVNVRDLGSYAARRGHHDIAVRATFANPHILNEMVGRRGPLTRIEGHADPVPIFDAAMFYKARNVETLVFAGRNYGSGSSRDWAAKGLAHLGVRAVIAESFERIHRANLVAVAVLPLTFPTAVNRKSLALDGTETFALRGLRRGLTLGGRLELAITRAQGDVETLDVDVRIETEREAEVLAAGGLMAVLLDRQTAM